MYALVDLDSLSSAFADFEVDSVPDRAVLEPCIVVYHVSTPPRLYARLAIELGREE